MSALSMMRDTCVLVSKTVSLDTAGGPSIISATGTTTYPCMVDVTSDESMEGGRESPVLRGQIYLPFGTPVTSNHVINVSSGLHSGRSFAVNGTPVDDVGRRSHLVCEVTSNLDGVR